MEKKRFKMYKKGKIWVVAPIVFLGVIGLAGEKTVVHADQIETAQVQQVNEEASPTSSEDSSAIEETADAMTNELPNEDETTAYAEVPVERQTISEGSVEARVETPAAVQTKLEDTERKNAVEPAEAVTDEHSTDAETAIDETKKETTTSSEKTEETVKESASVQSSQPVEEQTTASSTKATTESSAATRSAAAKAAKIAIYRVYNPNSGEHLHTMNANERDYLVRVGWRNEGISMYVDGTGNQLYRLYNPNSGEHFYTLNGNERDNLKKHGWRYEGVAWKTPKTGQPMYRVFNPNSRGAGSHHYTMLLSERNDLVKKGWRNEGIAWYTAGGSQSVASYVLLNAPFINQYSAGYPMGCEAASLLQALQVKGYAKNYNLKSFIKEMPMSSNNNPNNGFSGKPDNVVSGIYHSIYAKPLANWGNKYGKVADISGVSVETLKDELRKGNPVVVYVTGDYAAPRYGKYWWGTGIDNAHVVTLDGFNQSNNSYHISDPAGGKYWVSGSKFEASYNLRKSAVVVR